MNDNADLRPLPGAGERTPTGEPPATRATARADQRRRILAATGELVGKRGYHGTTMELITRRAQIGYTTFHKHFGDKEAAYLAFFDEVAEATLARMHTAIAKAESWPDQVAAALGALFEAIAERPIVARACLVEVLSAGPAAVARYEAALAQLVPILRPGREHGPRAAELPDGLESTLAGGVLWVPYQRLVAGEPERVPELFPETLEFVLLPYLGEREAARVARSPSLGNISTQRETQL